MTNVHFGHQDFRACLVLRCSTNATDPFVTEDWTCPGNCEGMSLLQRTGFSRLLSGDALWLIILFLVGFCSFVIRKESSGFSESKLPTEMTVVTVVGRAVFISLPSVQCLLGDYEALYTQIHAQTTYLWSVFNHPVLTAVEIDFREVQYSAVPVVSPSLGRCFRRIPGPWQGKVRASPIKHI